MPEEVAQAVGQGWDCLPQRSRVSYEQAYANFISWKALKEVRITNEVVLLTYFEQMSKICAPSTLLCRWAMLEMMIKRHEQIHIDRYPNLKCFIEKKNAKFCSKAVKTFTDTDIKIYLTQAPDHENLDAKAALILTISGNLKCKQIQNIRLRDIRLEETHLVVSIPITQTKVVRTFTITSPLKEVIEKFIKSRPSHQTHEELFLDFRHGKCTSQVMSIDKINQMPERIATWLNLEDPEKFTVQSLTHTSAMFFANVEASMATMKQHRVWNPTMVVENYIAVSVENKKIYNQIMINMVDDDESDHPARTVPDTESCKQPQPSTSSQPTSSELPAATQPSIVIKLNNRSIAISYPDGNIWA
ncbi:hypothetical protein QAD02_016021 [Eretmocerus hayati]|uniref:Uncharacterized protein n=1 Tax=Eretmocerus hayati TaxID=131215 RepID=A0ACC2PAA8_9HYME|nr:hypothetical protein QAD02_016021 [Eretmocerus hayati]